MAKSALDQLTRWMLDAHQETMRILATFWLDVPTQVDAGAQEWLQSVMKPITLTVAMIGLMVAGGRLALRQDARDGHRAAEGLLRLVLVVSAGTAAVLALVEAGDEFSSWIVRAATTGSAGPDVSAVGAGIELAFASSGLQFVVGALAVLGGFLQLAFMLARAPLIVIMLALWPSAAAASTTETGVDWFRKSTAWLIALVLYKPVAAVIYAGAFRMMRPGSGALSVLQGVMLIFLAILALPALMRFFVPAVSAVGGGKGAAAAAAGVATGAISVGAAAATLGMAGGAGASGAGSAGSAGASGAGSAGAAGAAGSPGSGGGGSDGGWGGSPSNGAGPASGSGDSAGTAAGGGGGATGGSAPTPVGAGAAGAGSAAGGAGAAGAGAAAGPVGMAAGAASSGISSAVQGAQRAPSAVIGNEEDRK